MRSSRTSRRSSPADSGSALIITLMVMALVAALATTVATLSIRNLQSARLSQQGGVAVNAADAGIAEAVSYLRANGVGKLCAAPTVPNPPAPDFDKGFDLARQTCVTGLSAATLSAATPVDGRPYSVVIFTKAAYPTNGVGSYTVYSKGVGGEGAARLVAADITVTGGGTPRGTTFFAHAVTGSGTVSVNQSIFSTGCVYSRTKITMPDPATTPIRDAYGLPPAIHSSRIITDDGGTDAACTRTSKAIHNDGFCPPSTNKPPGSNLNQLFDQDALGGPLTASSDCVTKRPSNVPAATWQKYYADGSMISSPEKLMSLFDIKDPPLGPTEIARLRAVATSQGNLYCATASAVCPQWTSGATVKPDESQAVLFYDLTTSSVNGNADENVRLNTIDGFGYTPGSCPNRSLVVVVVGGNTTFPSAGFSVNGLVASVFVTTPNKIYDATGGVLVGSVYADKISLGGNATVSPAAQACANSNPSPTLIDFNVSSYREIDG